MLIIDSSRLFITILLLLYGTRVSDKVNMESEVHSKPHRFIHSQSTVSNQNLGDLNILKNTGAKINSYLFYR